MKAIDKKILNVTQMTFQEVKKIQREEVHDRFEKTEKVRFGSSAAAWMLVKNAGQNAENATFVATTQQRKIATLSEIIGERMEQLKRSNA